MLLSLERGRIVVATLYLLKILWSASEVPLKVEIMNSDHAFLLVGVWFGIGLLGYL